MVAVSSNYRSESRHVETVKGSRDVAVMAYFGEKEKWIGEVYAGGCSDCP